MSSVAGYDIFKIVGDQDKVELFRPADTPECRDRGYSGRLGIFESFTISDQIGKLIMAKKSERDIQKQAIEEGMITMLQDGFMKALEGHTTIEEVLRVQN
jgi:general secretion pathway protein E